MHSPAFLVPRSLIFVSNRQKGLLEAIKLLFPDSPHGYCLRHLYVNMHKKHKNHSSGNTSMMRLGPLQSMNTMLPFRECKTLIDPGAVKWLELHALKENWCEYYFT